MHNTRPLLLKVDAHIHGSYISEETKDEETVKKLGEDLGHAGWCREATPAARARMPSRTHFQVSLAFRAVVLVVWVLIRSICNFLGMPGVGPLENLLVRARSSPSRALAGSAGQTGRDTARPRGRGGES